MILIAGANVAKGNPVPVASYHVTFPTLHVADTETRVLKPNLTLAAVGLLLVGPRFNFSQFLLETARQNREALTLIKQLNQLLMISNCPN